MSPGLGPVAPRRRLGAELRRLREGAGLKIEQVAAELECSVSKVSRLETGKGIPKARDVRDLLDRYRVTDAAQRDRLFRWGRDGQRQGWWSEYSDVLVADLDDRLVPDGWDRYVALEADAAAIASFEPLVVHGLLQTEEYARAVLGALSSATTAREQSRFDRWIEVRMRRQQRLYADQPLRLDLVLDEAALRRPIGGDGAMRRQLQRLLDDSERPGITIQVLPFSVGMHRAIAGSFVLLRFEDADDHDMVYIESHVGNLYLERTEDVATYEGLVESLHGAALDVQRSRDLIATLRDGR